MRSEEKQGLDVGTEERLFDSGLRLFLEHGYEEIEVLDICEDAGVSEDSFYQAFPSKGEFAADLYGSIIGRGIRPVVKILESELSPWEKMDRYIETTVNAFIDHRELLVLYNRLPPDVPVARYIVELGDIVMNPVVRIIEDAKRSGLMETDNPTMSAFLLSAMLDKFCHVVILLDIEMDPGEVVECAREFIFKALYPEPDGPPESPQSDELAIASVQLEALWDWDVMDSGTVRETLFDVGGERQKRAIQNSARKLFVERGFGATSMSDIAKEAGVPETSLTVHFDSKADILSSIYARITGGGGMGAGFIAQSSLSPWDKLGAIFDLAGRMLEANHDILQLFHFHSPGSVIMGQNIRFGSELTPHVVSIINSGLEQGIMKSENPEMTGILMFSMVEHATHMAMILDLPVSMIELMEYIKRIVFKTLRPFDVDIESLTGD